MERDVYVQLQNQINHELNENQEATLHWMNEIMLPLLANQMDPEIKARQIFRECRQLLGEVLNVKDYADNSQEVQRECTIALLEFVGRAIDINDLKNQAYGQHWKSFRRTKAYQNFIRNVQMIEDDSATAKCWALLFIIVVFKQSEMRVPFNQL
ncbi:hypothetical protein ABPG72_011169 [Tetrahymena utriculariae]